jgi:hypothetical protein
MPEPHSFARGFPQWIATAPKLLNRATAGFPNPVLPMTLASPMCCGAASSHRFRLRRAAVATSMAPLGSDAVTARVQW